MKGMKKCYLDTNILVAYKIEESPHHAASIKLIEKLIQEEMYLFISPLGIDERSFHIYPLLI